MLYKRRIFVKEEEVERLNKLSEYEKNLYFVLADGLLCGIDCLRCAGGYRALSRNFIWYVGSCFVRFGGDVFTELRTGERAFGG